MPFIIAKTVTYVSSLTVTYVTTLYILASRQVGNVSVWLNGSMFSVVRIRPSWLVTESLYCAGGYEPPLQWLVRETTIYLHAGENRQTIRKFFKKYLTFPQVEGLYW